MKTVAKKIAASSEMEQVAVVFASMWALCAVLILLE
jgi:hypothetical protein